MLDCLLQAEEKEEEEADWIEHEHALTSISNF